MRILYLCLKNYASIYTAMKKKKLILDLSKSKNRIVLLIGDNGTGKTSIMSALQPFAYSGNGDVRNSEDLILPEVDGYKEIHIENGEVVYIIKHHYIYNKTTGRTIKSFITKDGIELNSNGNVKSFIEIVLLELGLEIDFLKLLRLGSNVTNFIDMKASERKNFTSELLSDIDIYSQFYKKINEDTRILKTVLRSVIEKIDKLKILDEQDIVNEILLLSNKLTDLNLKKDNINSSMWTKRGALESLVPEGVKEFLTTLNDESEQAKVLANIIKHDRDKLKKLDVIIIDSVDDSLMTISSNINNNENLITTNTNMINFYFKQLEIYFTQKDEKENSLKYISSDSEYSKLSDMYLQFSKTKEKYDKLYKNYVSKCTKEDMLTALRLMQEIDSFISNIHTFNHDGVVKVIDHIMNRDNIDYIIKENVNDIDSKISNLKLMNSNNDTNKNKVFILMKPTECRVNNCSYINFYKTMSGNTNETPISKIKKDINILEDKREFFLSLGDINKNIEYILLLIKSNSVLINKMPEPFFDITKLLTSIKNCLPFFNENKVTAYITALEELEDYRQLKDKLKDIKKELTFIEKNAVSLSSMRKELSDLDINIYKIQTDIEKLKTDNLKLTKRNDNFRVLFESLSTYKEISLNIELKRKELERLLSSIENKKGISKRIEEFVLFKQDQEKKIIVLNNEIKKIEDNINNNKFKLKEFELLSKERILLEDKFDEISILREALSSNKGMPLLFIQLYLKNTKMIVNNLLDFIFKGELEIDDFEINDKEFKIPYIKNGIRVNDIISTSQGEMSFVSLALSFALITQSIEKYNILLLDEIDSTLSQKNRPLFLSILEKQLDIINAKQAFLTTHSNVFDNYPVDLIITSDVNIDNYTDVNILFSYAA